VGEDGVETEIGAVEEGREFRETKGKAFGRGGSQSNVAEFAAGARNLSIEMKMGVGNTEDF